MKKTTIAIISIGLFFSQAPAYAYIQTTFNGVVTGVHDGDSLTVINELGAREKIRVHRIDSPEMPYCFAGKCVPLQPYAIQSRDALKTLCLGKVTTIIRKGLSGTRTVGTVKCQGVDVGTYQLTNGNAWVYRYTSTIAARKLQSNAHALGVGLWAKPSVEPYLWRRGVRE